MSSGNATYSMIICTLISQRLEERGLTQQDFFRRSGIATGTWSRIARGQAHFQIEDLRSACRVLNWSIGNLTSQADKMAEALEKKEDVNVVSKEELKAGDSNTGAFIAGAALAFLLTRLN
ncbi:helix-turn-helix domain-containing protein [Monaibacterium marinum]|uniref:helix-turn-helix domain-containing protein n=1 Tax=Pontivivens marinum TaxID=1690039 RepID=UPI0011AF75DD|nr:helix-turn-helix transcriptional regulator [Monaibacterium marinum]